MGADELADANPQNWYVRVMFDELLDPNVEELVAILDPSGSDTGLTMGTLKNTQPVTLQCQSINGGMVDVPYDGYYSPAGNKLTWPVGPSLVITPSEPARVATQSECQITLKDTIKDKDGNPVPADQRGPFKFKIAPVSIVTANTSPADGDKVDAIDAGVDVTFNTFIDGSTIVAPLDPPDGTETFNFTPSTPNAYAFDETPITGVPEFFFGADFEVNKMYTWAFKAGAKIKDQCGKETTLPAPSKADGTQIDFTTNPIALRGIAPFDTQMNAKPSDKVQIKFNQYMDPATFTENTDWTLTPAVAGQAASVNSSANLIVKGQYKPNTDYTFTLKANAMIDDCPGGEFGSCVKSAMGGTYTNAMGDQVVHFHTAAIALTSVSPADLGTVTLGSSGKVTILLTFNADMAAATLGNTEYTISPAITFGAAVNAKPNIIALQSTGAVAPGDYTFTLKMGATIDDQVPTTPDTYTQAADKVIHFTVVAAPTTTAPACF